MVKLFGEYDTRYNFLDDVPMYLERGGGYRWTAYGSTRWDKDADRAVVHPRLAVE